MTSNDRLLPVAVFASCGLLLAFGLAHPTFAENFTDTDKLLPAEWTRHVFIEGLSIFSFQLPRTPSLLPDLLLYTPIQLITGSWRIAAAATALVFLAVLIGAGGVIVGRIARVSVGDGIACFWILVFPLLLIELTHSGWGRHFMVIQPVSHGGAFVVSLGTAILADDLRRSPRWGMSMVLGTICSLAVLSDKMFVFSFMIPLMCAIIVVPATAPARRSLLAVAILATAAGMIADLFVLKEPDLPLIWSMIPQRIALVFREMSASIFLGTFAPVLLLFAAPPVARRLAPTVFRDDRVRFFWIIAVAAILGTTALTVGFLYEELAHYRYLSCAIWWPIIFAGAALAMWLRERRRAVAALTVLMTVIAAGLSLTVLVSPGPSLWRWRNPIERCLNDAAPDLREGLAAYDFARSITASNGWRVHADAILPTGAPFYWGNSFESYTTSHFDHARPPDYRFVVMTSVDPAAITARYGQPDRTIDCSGNTVWLYDRRLTVNVQGFSK